MLLVNSGFFVLVLVFAVVIAVRYLLIRNTRRKLLKHYFEALEERGAFLETFKVTPFDDFSAFDFETGRLSHVSPFPSRNEGEWRYRIHLSRSEADDVATIAHEISECTLGRAIEKLLNLEKPLYLQRKEDDKFWVHGEKQRYLVEHVMVTLGEGDDLTHGKLMQRLNREDARVWLDLKT